MRRWLKMKGSYSEARTLGSVVRSSFRERWPKVRRFDFDPRSLDPLVRFWQPGRTQLRELRSLPLCFSSRTVWVLD